MVHHDSTSSSARRYRCALAKNGRSRRSSFSLRAREHGARVLRDGFADEVERRRTGRAAKLHGGADDRAGVGDEVRQAQDATPVEDGRCGGRDGKVRGFDHQARAYGLRIVGVDHVRLGRRDPDVAIEPNQRRVGDCLRIACAARQTRAAAAGPTGHLRQGELTLIPARFIADAGVLLVRDD
jgi:hypothetical protein